MLSLLWFGVGQHVAGEAVSLAEDLGGCALTGAQRELLAWAQQQLNGTCTYNISLGPAGLLDLS